MLDPKIIHEIEQANEAINELLPIMHQYYRNAILQGFTKDQSFELTRDIFIRGSKKHQGELDA